MNLAIRYGGRLAGALLAWKLAAKKVPGGYFGAALVVAAGWLAGGLAVDAFGPKAGP